MMTILEPGLQTTIQDLGRFGFQKYGITTSGAADPFSHRLANLLAGNDETMPTMEITMFGPAVKFHKQTLISICGADLSATIDNQPVPLFRPVLVNEGKELHFTVARKGMRAYLAVAGGFRIPKIMNSHSTSLITKIGGVGGRTLEAGDELLFNRPGALSRSIISALKPKLKGPFAAAGWSAWHSPYDKITKTLYVRVVKGRHFGLFSPESRNSFFHSPYIVTSRSDRMGCRLQGEPLRLTERQEIISEPVNDGTIQVSSDGNPIILLAERQTTGGYPKIAQVAAVDIPLIAQAKPGDRIRFVPVSHEEAQKLFIRREVALREIKWGIRLKYLDKQEDVPCIRWI